MWHQELPLRVGNGLDLDDGWRAHHAAKDGGKGGVGGVAARAKAHKTHGNGHARRVKHVPAVAQVNLHIGVKVGGPEHGVGTVVNAGGKAGGNVHRAAQRNHQVGKVAAHADLFNQRVHRGGVAI